MGIPCRAVSWFRQAYLPSAASLPKTGSILALMKNRKQPLLQAPQAASSPLADCAPSPRRCNLRYTSDPEAIERSHIQRITPPCLHGGRAARAHDHSQFPFSEITKRIVSASHGQAIPRARSFVRSRLWEGPLYMERNGAQLITIDQN